LGKEEEEAGEAGTDSQFVEKKDTQLEDSRGTRWKTKKSVLGRAGVTEERIRVNESGLRTTRSLQIWKA